MLVRALVPEPSIETFRERVLGGLSWRDVMPLHAALLLPSQDRVTGQFGAIIADDYVRLSSPLDQPIKLTGHAHA